MMARAPTFGSATRSAVQDGGAGMLAIDLAGLLAEPEVRLMMNADGVDGDMLLSTLQSLSASLAQQRATEKELSDREDQDLGGDGIRRDDNLYRPGVGVVLLNSKNDVFVGRRIDLNHDAWQMPQGGIDPGEEPCEAALRELREEIGTDHVVVVAESKKWLRYRLPENLAKKAWNGRWLGQRQKWFVMLFKGKDADINIRTEHPEFSAWKWVPLADLPAIAVSFKHQLYKDVVGEFTTIFRD